MCNTFVWKPHIKAFSTAAPPPLFFAISFIISIPIAISIVITMLEVHARFDCIAAISGLGSSSERTRALRELLARATQDNQLFLSRLLIGELRQGAQEGVMAEAISKATLS